MRNLELPTRMSPCLQLFIESLFEPADPDRCGSPTSQGKVLTAIVNPSKTIRDALAEYESR